MRTLSEKTQGGDIFTAVFSKEAKGWYVDKNGHSIEFVPYNKPFKLYGITKIAISTRDAISIGKLMITINDKNEQILGA